MAPKVVRERKELTPPRPWIARSLTPNLRYMKERKEEVEERRKDRREQI